MCTAVRVAISHGKAVAALIKYWIPRHDEFDGVGRPVVTVFRSSNSVDWMLPRVAAPLLSAPPVHDGVFEKRMCTTSEVAPGHIQCLLGSCT